tara:strand:+ start:832 stop:1362 length:531 start_codon:yes stop_codon:yes gene_type:complete
MNKKQSQKTGFGIRGVYREVVRNIETGEIIDVYEDDNLVLDNALNYLVRCIGESGFPTSDITELKLGNDVGSGTLVTPDDPTADLDGTDQSVVYSIPSGEFFTEFPQNNQVRFFATVNGATVMANYPDQPNVVYTSAVLYQANGDAFSYKRFSGRTISRLISIDISWTISITNETV